MFKRGKKKTGGRKPGVKNKGTILLEERREEAYELVNDVLSFIKEEMQSEDNGRKLKAIEKLSPILPFILPKLANVETKLTGDNTVTSITFKTAKKKGKS